MADLAELGWGLYPLDNPTNRCPLRCPFRPAKPGLEGREPGRSRELPEGKRQRVGFPVPLQPA
jgi:MoaA/NifB/PqqE/SkfB family radical SAM enzyme